ncbi:MAG: SH3 domain-containing protein [Anaerolineae bacterium]
MLRWFVLLLSTFWLIPPTFAQSDCSAVVDAALNSVSTACAGLARNQACYGNINLQATAREGVPQFTFERPGDIANVADMENLRLAGMSLTDEVWGIAVMKLQANLPSTLPGQNVTVLLFGDVYVSNAVDPVAQSTLVATGNVNVRLRPTTTTNNVMASLVSGQEVIANGRLANNSWIRIVVEGDARGVGWVSSQFLDGDIEELSIVEPEQPLFGPMQAFYLQTGISDSPCAEV